MRTATIEDFKVGTELFMKKGGWSFVIRRKYDDGIWEAKGEAGEKCVFEGEAEHYQVKIY